MNKKAYIQYSSVHREARGALENAMVQISPSGLRIRIECIISKAIINQFLHCVTEKNVNFSLKMRRKGIEIKRRHCDFLIRTNQKNRLGGIWTPARQ
jgi:hypothetical protein